MIKSLNKPKTSFWIISSIALIWNLMGVGAYLSQAYMSDEMRATLPEVQRSLLENTPAWVTASFAIAVFGGVIGCILLLLRKKTATLVFLISLLAILVQMSYSFFLSNALEVFGIGNMIMSILVILIGLFLYFYAKRTAVKGWLN